MQWRSAEDWRNAKRLAVMVSGAMVALAAPPARVITHFSAGAAKEESLLSTFQAE